ncbi:MAG: YabP/YqfC family sporulation protein [Oscillospiraceae bacterium]|jgi:sporulation protein YqfC|nr:YabP/YqfC family sporulation protein [Oscillospiraceae bacterium]
MKEKLIDDLAGKLSIPAESFASVPLTELRGKRNVCVENHGGIMEYTDERVKVAVRRGAICVIGSDLCIERMTRRRVEIRGNIRALELE